MGVRAQAQIDAVTTTAGDARYVNVTGDTMTGALAITGAGLAVDTNVLVVDATNDRVGIRDAAPSNLLSLKTSGTTGDYTFVKSGLIVKNDAGVEVLRIWATDPNEANFNTCNLFIGNLAGESHPTDNVSAGYFNTGVGLRALRVNTTGFQNSAFGADALKANTTGGNNAAFGTGALQANTIGTNSSAFGAYALSANTEGLNNFGMGSGALSYNTTGDDNVAVGTSAGVTGTPANANVTGNNNVWIGSGSGPSTATQLTNAIAIGYQATNSASNQAVLGNASITATTLFGTVTVPTLSLTTGATFAETVNIIVGTTTGTKIGTAITQKLGFYNATPIVQRAGAAQVAVATTGATNVAPFGYTTAAQANAIVTLVNELRDWAVAQGFIKGAA